MRRLSAVLTVVVLLALPACNDDAPRGARVFEATETPTTETPEVYDQPPPLQLLTDRGQSVDAWQGSYCWNAPGSSRCVDTAGPDPATLPDVGAPETVDFYFPITGTEFSASLTPVEGECRRSYDGTVSDFGDGRYSLDPAGPPGRYLVELVGRTPQGGAPGAFIWTTPVAGELGEPRAEISIVWKPHGKIEGQKFQMMIEDLAVPPRRRQQRSLSPRGTARRPRSTQASPNWGAPSREWSTSQNEARA